MEKLFNLSTFLRTKNQNPSKFVRPYKKFEPPLKNFYNAPVWSQIKNLHPLECIMLPNEKIAPFYLRFFNFSMRHVATPRSPLPLATPLIIPEIIFI